MGRDYGSYFTGSNFMSILQVIFRFEFILEFNGEMYALCLWFKFMEYVYGASLWVLFRHTFYEVVFYVDFRGCVFGFSFQSNIWIDYT